MCSIGTKGFRYTSSDPFVLQEMICPELVVENFNTFIVNAAVQFCLDPEEVPEPVMLFANPLESNISGTSGTYKMFESEKTRNHYRNNVKYNHSSQTNDATIDDVFKKIIIQHFSFKYFLEHLNFQNQSNLRE